MFEGNIQCFVDWMSIYIILIIQYLETKFDDIKMKAW